MNGKFKAAFIIPLETKKVLTENGWEFDSVNRLSMSIRDYFINAFKLRLLERYLGIESYAGENRKMSVFYDDGNQIESIYFQLSEDALKELRASFEAGNWMGESGLFIPGTDLEGAMA